MDISHIFRHHRGETRRDPSLGMNSHKYVQVLAAISAQREGSLIPPPTNHDISQNTHVRATDAFPPISCAEFCEPTEILQAISDKTHEKQNTTNIE